MWLVKFSIENPVKVAVAALFFGIFGAISIRDMPVQMTPTVDKPEISIQTIYPSAAPAEVEEQITTPIEERLQAVEGVRRITSSSREGGSTVELEFDWGVNKDTAVIDIIKRLARVRDLPQDADEPIVIAGATSERRPIYWANLRGLMPVDKMRELADDMIAPRLARIEGVAEVRIYGGQEREIQVVLDFEALYSRGVTISQVASALKRENLNARGGDIDIGKRRYLVRTVGLFQTADEINDVIITKNELGAPVYIKDVATVYDTYKKRDAMVRILGEPAIALGIVKKSGSNTIEVTTAVERTMAILNKELERNRVAIYESYDSSDYIWESIDFVTKNLGFGALFSVSVLFLFLHSARSSMIIGLTIPIVAASGFILLNVFGRSLNIVSLAGMAFAVGMVVDNSIVVLENIHRHLQLGKDRGAAALDGSVEVWGAVLASTLTTLAVFVPIVYIEEEAGQLFKDIAIAVSVSVFMSLLVSMTVIPALAARIMTAGDMTKKPGILRRILDYFGGLVASLFIWTGVRLKNSWMITKIVIVIIITVSAIATLPYAPKMEYLPKGNRNLIFVMFKPYVGTNFDTIQKHSEVIVNQILKMEETKYVFHVVSSRFNGIGIRVKDSHRLKIADVTKKINGIVSKAVGFEFVRAFQTSLFSRLTGTDIEIEIKGKNLGKIASISKDMQGQLFATKGVSFARSNLETGAPEFRVTIDRERASDLQLSAQDIADVVETLVAGKTATLFKVGGQEYDITIKGAKEKAIDKFSINSVSVYGANGTVTPLDSVARVDEAVGPTQINHIELSRSVTLAVTKNDDSPLQQVVETIEAEILDPVRKALGDDYYVSMSGSARDLERTAKQLTGSFALAVIIVYLLMAALFESFLYPLIIMFSVPLAASGAILAVVLTNSRLDVLTMLGFIILTGIVVNNAILLIHQARTNTRVYGMDEWESVVEAIRSRIRPIFMSSATTALGLLPLVIRSGAGSELYSGLAASIVGGLTISTVFTLVMAPALSFIMIDIKAWFRTADEQ